MKKRSLQNRKRWLLLVAIPFAAMLLWLIGVGVFRQTAPKANVIASSSPPARLNSPADYLAQGDYDFEQGNLEQAIAEYTRAIELDPNFAEAYNNRAYAYMSQEKYAAALPDLNKALELRPNYVNALMNRGDIYNYYYSIDYDRAVADYDRVLAIDPDAPAHTSVCGHRLLAFHRGWNVGVFGELFTRRSRAGCPDPAAR